MIDREKVIKGLQYCFATKNCDGCPYEIERRKISFKTEENHCPILDDVLALLKEQEAKPVIVTTNAYGTRFYHCPKCNRDLFIYPRQLYCSNCGQAVMWE